MAERPAVGPVTGFEVARNVAEISALPARARIVFLTEDVFRIQVAPDGHFTDPAEPGAADMVVSPSTRAPNRRSPTPGATSCWPRPPWHCGCTRSRCLRHPALLAKEAVTVDQLSGGRLELGIGTGIAPFDHAALGSEPWSAGERVARFAEYVEVVDGLLRGDGHPYYFEGRFFRVREAPTAPAGRPPDP